MSDSHSSIKEWPEQMRPREKLLQYGAQSLSDSELLAIFLRTGVKGCSAVELANRLLVSFGGLNELLGANQQQFCEHLGLGPAKYAQLSAVLEMSKRFYRHQLESKVSMTSSNTVAQYLSHLMRELQYECFYVLYLDNQNQLISCDEVFRGTINAASVYPREIVREVIKYNAASVILSHNHPSGIATPSEADRRITQRIVDALALIDVTVLDHFIIGQNDPYSFADHGLL
ncbi:MAG: RadC family protein [Psychrobium sp.]